MPNRYSRVEVTALIAVWSAVACVPEITVRPSPDAGDAASDVGTDVGIDDRPEAAVDAPTDDRPAPVDAVDVSAADSGDDAPGDSGATDSGVCPAGTTRCGADCVETATDARHCGGCGVDCRALPHVTGAGVSCAAGACVVAAGACEAGWGHCAGAAGGGCETRLATADDCGACGRRCTGETPVCSTATATAACASGCAATQTRCGASCVDPQQDISHCGACGRACPVVLNARSVCAAGACGFECVSGYHRCGDRCADDASPATCGSSCVSCLAPAGAAATCAAGQCGFACPPGQHRCGDRCADNASVASCGAACGACVVPANGSATCDGAACGVACDAGYARSGSACVAIAAPRPVAPLSTARVTSRRPLLSWALAAATDGARVELCRQRACTTVALTIDAAGGSGTPPRELEPGVWFWRLRGRAAGSTGLAAGPTWQFEVGARSAPAGRSWGTTSDFNGDGYADVVVGASGANGGAGRVHIYRGSATGVATTPSQTLNGINEPDERFGGRVTSAGDTNGDGYADLLVGAVSSYTGGGRALIFAGGPLGPSSVPVVLNDPDHLDAGFGTAVTSAGDLNGDGYADIAVGAPFANSRVGRVHVYLGSATGIRAAPALSLSGPDGAGGDFGFALAGGTDVNGDGLAELVVGAPGAAGRGGLAHLYAGIPSGLSPAPTTSLTGPDGVGGSFGSAFSASSDVNGDGYADLLVGAPSGASSAGRVHLYLGRAAGLATAPAVSFAGPDGSSGQFGASIAGGGDMNGDGYQDFSISAAQAARIHIFLGRAVPFASPPALSITGPSGSSASFGRSVANSGDVNGDGYTDLAAGDLGTNLNEGRVGVYLGAGGGPSSTPTVTLVGPDGMSGNFGTSLAFTGVGARRPRAGTPPCSPRWVMGTTACCLSRLGC